MRRPTLTLLAAALAAAGSLVGISASPAQAAGFQMRVLGAPAGGVGVDGGGVGYDPCKLGWGADGIVRGSSNGGNLRFELYPGGCAHLYDPWGDVGGVHIEATAAQYANAGDIQLPVIGRPGVFRMTGRLLSSSKIDDGRVIVDTFQVPSGYPDPPAPLQTNGTVSYGTFASVASRGSQWTGGPAWAGFYRLFVNDTATGRKISTLVNISASSIPTIDLDAICFGFDICDYLTGGPGVTAGTFHPTNPTRILDSRLPLGSFGPLQSGDGRNSSPDPVMRRLVAANHELQVTGVAGIPTSGVSAVLLNVTAVSAGAPGPGYMSVIPKPPRVGNLYDDQASFGAFPSTSNLNINNGDPTPNLVLARVGAGGKIRLYNYLGPTHVIADVAGWFGTGGAHTDGAGFEGVVPARLLDSRLGIGGPQAKFSAGESRTLHVAGVGGVPANAESVVVNVTMVGASRGGYVTAYPAGQSVPNASNVNVAPNGVRSNTSVVKVGRGGNINLFVGETDSDVIVDILGSFGHYGGKVTSITPERVADTRSGIGTPAAPLGENQSRTITIAGRGSVPANATAVIANVTATNTNAWGYLSVWPAGAKQPTSSNLNFLPGETVPNLVMIKLGTGGAITVLNGLGSANVLVDVMGYVS